MYRPVPLDVDAQEERDRTDYVGSLRQPAKKGGAHLLFLPLVGLFGFVYFHAMLYVVICFANASVVALGGEKRSNTHLYHLERDYSEGTKVLIAIPLVLACMGPALISTNFVMFITPYVREYFLQEGARTGEGYIKSQSDLWVFTKYALVVTCPISLLSAIMGLQ
jgi:hypothetical protein